MSREPDIKRLKKSLFETQDILNDLIKETSGELEKNWDTTQKDVSKHLMKAGKRFEKTYEQARAQLDTTIKGTSRDLEKGYLKSRKDAEKAYDKGRDNAKDTYRDISAEARKRFADAKLQAGEKTKDLKLRSAEILQGVAAGVLALRNRMEPKTKYAIRNEKEKHHLGKGGYFKRFVALALIIVAKKDLMLSLGSQLYHKLQDKDAREAVKGDALAQYDTLRRLIKAYANGEYREFPYMSIVKIVAAVVYFVSVVDLIPDFIPVLGLTDDLAILAWVYASVRDDLQNFKDWEAANERRLEKMEEGRTEERKETSPAAQKPSASSPVADRQASPNTVGAARTSATPAATTPAIGNIGAGSSAINKGAAEGGGRESGSNAGGSSAGNSKENPNKNSGGGSSSSGGSASK